MDGIQVVVWNSFCSRCKIGVLLEEVTWGRWHSFRGGWWGYCILIVFFGEGMGRAGVASINFVEATEKWSIWRFWWGEKLGSMVYRFLGGHRKVEHVKAISWGECKTYRLWGGHTNEEYMETSAGSGDFQVTWLTVTSDHDHSKEESRSLPFLDILFCAKKSKLSYH